MDRQEAFDRAHALIQRHERVVFMMCGIAGSGKTTFAQELEKMGCERLSIDQEIWRANGRFALDYAEHEYAELRDAAEERLRKQLIEMLRRETKVVIDFSFWSAKARADYRDLVQRNDYRQQLVSMNIRPEILRERLNYRASRRDANAAFPIADELLHRYIQGFEPPHHENEWRVE
ncbi:ATP-binding protein [Rhizobium vallis]|uniref:ATP-binding protein n=1 Tax=Rhizobium vallis TaxID=634290 RepID=A0A432PHS4_9HYPH|nr:ATP-binding protein [Rhizobium vallis]RUM23853.1 ATP-binding protein [Rhizobium vallis]